MADKWNFSWEILVKSWLESMFCVSDSWNCCECSRCPRDFLLKNAPGCFPFLCVHLCSFTCLSKWNSPEDTERNDLTSDIIMSSMSIWREMDTCLDTRNKRKEKGSMMMTEEDTSSSMRVQRLQIAEQCLVSSCSPHIFPCLCWRLTLEEGREIPREPSIKGLVTSCFLLLSVFWPTNALWNFELSSTILENRGIVWQLVIV